ncbi:MAG: protease modulator HflC [Deltaproteobacteria bacterium]|nr:protease modulator HflC [Deltaproteobacteria bacterium]MBW1920640.1 protease modulator HflC [Deltaproteobacteria bacterium]MBW1936545.1 protease modulator HflC [Deltaproteobacteria bacterium]MBW2046126.1 protease modulator HflC [Deltaproteobacteria bacterium]RLB34767.1 MAG: protease modulator HflC [Deltaproteobacteria bacterium]
MKRMGAFLVVVLVIFLIVLISGVFYTVREWEQVVITQFGRPIGKPKTEAGLKFKIPFIQVVNRYEKRLMRWDGDPKEIPTRDKRFIYVDTTARWRIVDAQKFLEVLGTYSQAYAKLDDIIDAVLRDYVSANPLVELVRTTNEMLTVEEVEGKVLSPFRESTAPETVRLGREKITRAILAEASKAMSAFGMDLVDVRIKRINYVEQVRKKVYERMISERKRKAAQFRSEGEGKKAEILGQMEKELKSIVSGAYRTAEEIRGNADAKATKIYGDAYGEDPAFYAFFKTLETYKEAPYKNAFVILGTDSDYYRFLKTIPK